jgi:uncharacterized protein YdeI (YjbR/CyaY-like superfamily)
VQELKGALLFKDSSQWHRWLERNHDNKKEAWLIHYKKNSGRSSISLIEATYEALRFGWIDGKMKSVDGEKYILRYSPRRANSVWSSINKKRAEEIIATGSMTAAGMTKIEQARLTGAWDNAYSSKKQEKMPTDLTAALIHDEIARGNFAEFATSYRNNYIGWINEAKTEATRKKRIAEVVVRAHLKIKPGYKLL